MKIKPAGKKGGVIMELNASEAQIPVTATGQWLPPHPNFRLKRILVPLDFSACSLKALQYAIAVAQEFGGVELFLFHVVEPYYVTGELGVDLISFQADTERAANKQLEALQKTIEPACRIKVLRGSPAQEIIQEAKAMEADLIITSTHGRSGFSHLFMGSVAERVIQHAGCPVLVVRENEREFIETDAKNKRTQETKKVPRKRTTAEQGK